MSPIKQIGRFITNNSIENSDISSDFSVIAGITNTVLQLPMSECAGLTIYDMSLGNNGTLVGATWQTVKNRQGSRIYLDGIDDSIVINHNSSISFEYNTPLTILYAHNPTSIATELAFIMNKQDAANGYRGWGVERYLNGIYFRIHSASNLISVGSDCVSIGWNYYTITYNGDMQGNNVRIYKNGESQLTHVDANTLTALTCQNALNLRIGDYSEGVTAPMKGYIDEIEIYTRVLTATEIKRKYENYLLKNGNSYLYY